MGMVGGIRAQCQPFGAEARARWQCNLACVRNRGRPSQGVRINVHAETVSVHEANLMEDEGRELRTGQNSFRFDLHP